MTDEELDRMLADAEGFALLRDRRDYVRALVAEVRRLAAERDRLRAAIAEHHAQKADDRCWLDDDHLYAAAGLPPCDRRVGDKAVMLANCARFIGRRCEGGGWPTYAELEAERDGLAARVAELEAGLPPLRGTPPKETT